MNRFVRHRGFIASHLLLIVIVTNLTVAGALIATLARAPSYEATAAVVVRPEMPTGGGAPLIPDMATEREVALSGAVAKRAEELLTAPSPTEIGDGLTVEVPVDSHVLEVSYSAASPDAALTGASIFVRAYVEYRNATVASTSGEDPASQDPVAVVITPAERPTAPVPPRYPLIIALSVLIGAALAVATGFARDRLTGRLRDSDHVQELLGHPVIGSVAQSVDDSVDARTVLAGGKAPGAEVFGQVAARFVQRIDDSSSTSLLVTNLTEAAVTTSVAVHVAAAVAAAGTETILLASSDQLSSLGLDQPGASRKGQRSPAGSSRGPTLTRTGISNLHVAAAPPADGSTEQYGELAEIRALLSTLAKSGRAVVLDGPSLLGHHLTPVAAELTDATVVVVDPERESVTDVAAGGAALSHLADKVLGCVLHFSYRRTRRAGAKARPGSGAVTVLRDEDDLTRERTEQRQQMSS